ncbi:MAG: hypothetical protein WBW74_18220 [Xanthobacteraceae bacterium]
MRSADAALRLSVVLSVAGFIALAAGLYEIDRREKSGSDTVTANLVDMDRRIQILGNQIRILNDQYTKQLAANERLLDALSREVQALRDQHAFRLKQLEDELRVRSLESAPARR